MAACFTHSEAASSWVRHIRFSALGLALLLIYGCGTLAPKKTMPSTPEQLQHWHAQGKVGIRTPKEAHSANLSWRQTPPNYTIELYGPLGKGKISIRKQGDTVTLRTSQGERSAATAEALLKQTSGLEFPVAHLSYWIKGLTAPSTSSSTAANNPKHDAVSALSRGETGLIQSFEQAGWKIDYLRYMPVGEIMLPSKMKLQHHDYKLTVIVKKWQAL